MSQKKVIVRPVQHLYQLFQHQYMPPNKDWCVELLRERPDYYPDHYVEDAWVGYVLRPSLSHLVVPKIPIELEVAAQSQEECEPALVAHLNEMTGQFVSHMYATTHSCFNANDSEDMEKLSGGQAVLRAEWEMYNILAREGACVMISSETPAITSNGDGKLIVTWHVGFAILDSSGFACSSIPGGLRNESRSARPTARPDLGRGMHSLSVPNRVRPGGDASLGRALDFR